jgi:hypothetical protein
MKYVAFTELYNHADLAFVARAVGKDDKWPHFWHMKITEEDGDLLAIATDGRRLHKAQISQKDEKAVSPGYWRVLKNKSVKTRDYTSEDGLGFSNRLVYIKTNVLWLAKLEDFDLFPTDKVINCLYPPRDASPIKEGVVSMHKHHHNRSMNALIKNLQSGAGINLNYLKDLGPYEWKYKIFPGKPILFEHENKTGLIMPLDLEPGKNTKN